MSRIASGLQGLERVMPNFSRYQESEPLEAGDQVTVHNPPNA